MRFMPETTDAIRDGARYVISRPWLRPHSRGELQHLIAACMAAFCLVLVGADLLLPMGLLLVVAPAFGNLAPCIVLGLAGLAGLAASAIPGLRLVGVAAVGALWAALYLFLDFTDSPIILVVSALPFAGLSLCLVSSLVFHGGALAAGRRRRRRMDDRCL